MNHPIEEPLPHCGLHPGAKNGPADHDLLKFYPSATGAKMRAGAARLLARLAKAAAGQFAMCVTTRNFTKILLGSAAGGLPFYMLAMQNRTIGQSCITSSSHHLSTSFKPGFITLRGAV